MFKTSAKFRMLPSRMLEARRLASSRCHVPANENRRPRKPLVCRWSLAEGGTRLVCHWQEEADAPGPKPAHQPLPARPAHDELRLVTEPSYSQSA